MRDILAELYPNRDGVDYETLHDKILRRVFILNEHVWERKLTEAKVKSWLDNFTGLTCSVEIEKVHALYILSQFMYFGSKEIRVLLRALYRDLFYCPLIAEIRKNSLGSRDHSLLQQKVDDEILCTRFLGLGNPSESGVHLLYYFRQENCLDKDLFIDASRVFKSTVTARSKVSFEIADPKITRYVFIDDICGSGETAISYASNMLPMLRAKQPNARFYYLSIFATAKGLSEVKKNTLFGNNCKAVYELDSSYEFSSDDSRFLKAVPEGIDVEILKSIAKVYGTKLFGIIDSLGHKNGQMMMGFHHNTPDNSLPIFWAEARHKAQMSWHPIFRRYPKYGMQ